MPDEVMDAAMRAGRDSGESGASAKVHAPYLVTRGLVKGYGEGAARMEVLRGIDVEIARGEICVLLGPSGSGKSTFLNLIGGLEAADGGSIEVGGIAITTLGKKALGEYRRSELGFVFQFYNLVPDLTIRAKFPRQVSGGQQQRCAIGRALVKNPGLLLCDEPTGALDYKTSKEILALMEQVNRDYGCTIVIVTHNDAISRMANRVLRLRDGMLVENEMNAAPVSAAELVL